MGYRSGTTPEGSQRVVITGCGVLTSMGNGWKANAEGFRKGRSALKEITLFETSGQRVRTAGELPLPTQFPKTSLTSRQLARIDRASTQLVHATAEALEQAQWPSSSEDVPLILGTSAGAMNEGEAYYKAAHDFPDSRMGQAERVHLYQTQTQAATVANAFEIHGPQTIITNACASGANAIGHAFRQIKTRRCERALCGGYDALCQLVFAGFDSLQALSTSRPRPFDAERDGLALGEGAAMFCLEEREAALKRGARILAEVIGYGATTDPHHLTQPHPNGDAALTSMTAACTEAGIDPSEVDYLNSHGTGTPLNDVAEGNAIQRWAGEAVDSLSVSSTKGSIGHLLGGAGAVEAAICLMAMDGNWLPPNAEIGTPDAVCTFDLVREPREKEIHTCLTNSFGFGGANATVLFRKEPSA